MNHSQIFSWVRLELSYDSEFSCWKKQGMATDRVWTRLWLGFLWLLDRCTHHSTMCFSENQFMRNCNGKLWASIVLYGTVSWSFQSHYIDGTIYNGKLWASIVQSRYIDGSTCIYNGKLWGSVVLYGTVSFQSHYIDGTIYNGKLWAWIVLSGTVSWFFQSHYIDLPVFVLKKTDFSMKKV